MKLTYENAGWYRDFYPERISKLNRLLHIARGGIVKPTARQVVEIGRLSVEEILRQGRFIDTNLYYRLNGIDPVKAKVSCDILAIQYGIGTRVAETFEQQVQIAIDNGQKYFTWIIFDVDDVQPIVNQISQYFSHPLVSAAPTCVDVEKPRSTTRCINYSELKLIIETLKILSEYRVGVYSNIYTFEQIFPSGYPSWMQEVFQWVAQYLLDSNWYQYQYYDDFFVDGWEWSLPPAVTRSFLYRDQYWRDMVEAWQITSKGDAEYYIAVKWIYPGQPGIKSCDLNVSIRDLRTFIDRIFTKVSDPGIPPVPECSWDFQAVRNVNYRSEPVVTSASYLGTIQTGQVVHAIGIENPRSNDFWLKFDLDGGTVYTALLYSGTKYYIPL